MARNVIAVALTLVLPAVAWAGDLHVSAKVDKTTVNAGEPINLVITLGGDLAGAQVPQWEFPEGFVVLARSQSTNVAIRAGAMERSTSLSYVLVPQAPGTYALGPFRAMRGAQEVQTETIEITVKKPVLPPNLRTQGERFSL